MGMAAAIPKTSEMGSAYSLSHFSFGFLISKPQMIITTADTSMTQTGIRPEVADYCTTLSTFSPTSLTSFSITVTIPLASAVHKRETSQNTKPRNAEIMPINRPL